MHLIKSISSLFFYIMVYSGWGWSSNPSKSSFCFQILFVGNTSLSTTVQQGVKLTFFLIVTWLLNSWWPLYTQKKHFPWQTRSKFARATKRILEWVIYNFKGYLNPRWRLVTIDLHSKSCMCCVLEMGLTRNFAADLSLQIFKNH